MVINEAFIKDYLAYKAGRPLKLKELAKELKIPNSKYNHFRSMVKNMIDEGKLVRLRRGRIGIPSEMNLVVGPISIARTGIGTIYTESGEPIIVPKADTYTALDGDRVMVRIEHDDQDERFGRVIRIVERVERKILGVYYHGAGFNYVVPDDRKIGRDIYISRKPALGAREGDRVVVKISGWDDVYRNPEGDIIEVLGRPGDPGVDMLTVRRSYNLPEEFPQKVIDQAQAAVKYFSGNEIRRRRSFTRDIIYTIDPADAKDHDDAVSVSRTRQGYRLGVYIADVSHFVRPDTELDKEAFARGNSVYLPGMVIPMLPEAISNDLCSLRPNRRRLAYAILINFNKSGKMLGWEITEGVINSRARLSYEEVQEFFDTGRKNKRIARVADNLKLARQLAALLQKNRMAEGSLDFDLPEAKIVMNKKGEIIEIGSRVRLESHRLVEEFMLAANRAVALHVFRLAQKFLYRVHERPDNDKLEAFSYLVSTLGYRFPVSPEMKPIQFSRFLEKIKGKPEEEFLNELMLRSMMKAVYQPKNVGHFGLAFSHYTHFTSPIRRYPDLMVHRLLKQLKDGRYPPALSKRLDSILTHVGKHCSETERVAEAAERDAIKYKQVAYMANHIGDEYNGVISGILNFGFFVRLNELGAEGMVRLSNLDDDYYHYDERKFRLVGKQTGRVFRLGDPVKVGILSVDKLRNEINLFLVESKSKKRQVKKKKTWKKKRRRK